MPPRKPTYTPPQPAQLSREEMQRGILKLQKRIADLERFDPKSVPERFHSSVHALETSLEQTLDGVFGHDTIERRRFGSATSLDNGPISMGGAFGRGYEPDFRPYLAEGREGAITMLRQAISWLEEELGEPEPAPAPATPPTAARPAFGPEVFIVHGRNAGPKEAVARLIQKLGLRPVILHERANEGRTVIEKIEALGEAGFAVVLLTPDDVGGLAGEELQPRARQNVILELGYFLGRLGRRRVCTLALGAVELPSDWGGVIAEPYDDLGRWKFTLARELKAAGYPVDLNQIDEA